MNLAEKANTVNANLLDESLFNAHLSLGHLHEQTRFTITETLTHWTLL